MLTTSEIMLRARNAKCALSLATTQQKNQALSYMAESIIEHTDEILRANMQDVENSKGKISDVMIDRLRLTKDRINQMAEGILDVVKLPDPTGKVISSLTRPNGLVINKISVPIGVIAIIYESRPNVTSDAAALALKSGNVCVLRGGKEAHTTCFAVTDALRQGIQKAGLIPDIVQSIEDTSRNSASELMNGVGYIDLLIPRGGAGLIKACTENAKVPCIQTGTGICHVYVDKYADIKKALNIIENAKTQRPSVCNAAEVCLVHSEVAKEFLQGLKETLCIKRAQNGQIPVELKICPRSAEYINGTPAGENDFDTEFLDYKLAVKIVDSVREACEHIAIHSTGHSEVIVTENTENAAYFTSVVDSAAVYVNASSRFTDGGEFGLGCEIGISTQKLHARGPMGLQELTSYKYVITGNGQTR